MTKFDLGVKWVKVNPGSYLNNLGSTHVHNFTTLHTKFQGHRSIGSGEVDCLRVSPYMGMVVM